MSAECDICGSMEHVENYHGISYGEIREEILDGDVLLFRSRSVIGELLCWILGKEFTHAAIAAWWNGRLMVVEAVQEKGVIARPLSTVVEKYKGKIVLFGWDYDKRSIEFDEHGEVEKFNYEKLRGLIVSEACFTLGMEYGKWAAIKLGWELLWREKRVDVEEVRETLICSEGVSRWFRRSGIDLCPLLADKDTHPDDIAESEKLVKIGALK